MCNVSEKLKLYLKEKGYTQASLSELFGVSQPRISALISGKKEFGKKTAEQWEKKLNISASWLLTGDGEMLKSSYPVSADSPPISSDATLVPLLPVDAVGGRLDGFAADGVMLSNCEKIMSPFGGTDFGMRVKGDSMFPEYPNGCLIFIKRNVSTWIEWGRVYVLDTCDGVVLKQIVKSDLGDDYFCCRSFNVERGYTPFDIPRSDVFGVYRVLGLIAEKG